MIKICISGSAGKMGSRIAELAKEDPEALRVSGSFDVVEENPETFVETCDCLIEFTTPQATIEHLALCEKHKKAMVIGTTMMMKGVSSSRIPKKAPKREKKIIRAGMTYFSFPANALMNLRTPASSAPVRRIAMNEPPMRMMKTTMPRKSRNPSGNGQTGSPGQPGRG